jgi:(R,R)-butanediol dehydrogenase / meso-butanediol dehydrogenase / diacetyl reductase
MRAAVVNAEHGFDVVEVVDPTPGPDDLVLRVQACGICGSDLKAAASMPAGLVMGHEFCGEVVAVGADARDRWRDGMAVAALPLIGCGACAPCQTGDVAHCATVDMVGVGGSSGAYAQFVRVSAREAFALPVGLDELGALVEPLAVGLHAVARAALTPGDRVLVVGAGPVGLAVVLWARHLGAREVAVSDPVAHRRAAAERLGATRSVDPEAEELGGPFEVVFECVGVPGMIATAVGAAAVHGRVIVVGVCTKPDPFVPIVAVMKELAMHFVVYYRRQDFAYTVDMLRDGRIDVAPFVTQRVDLDGFPAAFEALKHPTDQCKVLVVP